MTVDCEIMLWGEISRSELQSLYSSCFYPFSYGLDGFIEAVKNDDELVFLSAEKQEISKMDTSLMRSGLGFRLDWFEAHSTKSIHTVIWDPDTQERHSFEMMDQKLYVPVDVLDCPDLLAKVQRGRKLFQTAASKNPIVYDSAHDLIEAIGQTSPTENERSAE